MGHRADGPARRELRPPGPGAGTRRRRAGGLARHRQPGDPDLGGAGGAGRGRRADRLRDPVRARRVAAPAGGRFDRGAPARRSGPLLSMATAGAMSLLVSELSRHSGPQFCGLVAAIPLVGMFAMRRELPARRCAADAAGPAAATSTAWRPRRRSSAPWAPPGRSVPAPGRGRSGLAAAACVLLAQHRRQSAHRDRIAAGPAPAGRRRRRPPFLTLPLQPWRNEMRVMRIGGTEAAQTSTTLPSPCDGPRATATERAIGPRDAARRAGSAAASPAATSLVGDRGPGDRDGRPRADAAPGRSARPGFDATPARIVGAVLSRRLASGDRAPSAIAAQRSSSTRWTRIRRFCEFLETDLRAVVAHDPACRSAPARAAPSQGIPRPADPSGRAQPVAAGTRGHRPLAVEPGVDRPRRRHPPGGADRQGRDARPRDRHRDRRNRRRRGRRDDPPGRDPGGHRQAPRRSPSQGPARRPARRRREGARQHRDRPHEPGRRGQRRAPLRARLLHRRRRGGPSGATRAMPTASSSPREETAHEDDRPHRRHELGIDRPVLPDHQPRDRPAPGRPAIGPAAAHQPRLRAGGGASADGRLGSARRDAGRRGTRSRSVRAATAC